MKKVTIIMACMIAAMFSGVHAQDTLDGRILRENYFYYGQTPEHSIHPAHVSTFSVIDGEYGKRFYTDSSLTVYGIAAAVKEVHDLISICDTSSANAFEYLRLYVQEQDTLRWLRQVRVNPILNPIAYYAIFDSTPHPYLNNWIAPMYERYFDSAITLSDTFYVGMTEFNPHNYHYKDSIYNYRYRPLELCWNYADPNDDNYEFSRNRLIYCTYQRDTNNAIVSRTWQNGVEGASYFILYPILTPPDSDYVFDSQDTTVVNPGDTIVLGNDTIAMGDTLIVCDTTIVGGDTIVNYDTILTIGQADLMQRLTGVMPNPAAEKARVVSSFGMSMVKVYNAGGELVHSQRADGLYVDLDVSRWPAGTYLVRIHTPQGIATKRLVVSR